jgi:hypothetical protein
MAPVARHGLRGYLRKDMNDAPEALLTVGVVVGPIHQPISVRSGE